LQANLKPAEAKAAASFWVKNLVFKDSKYKLGTLRDGKGTAGEQRHQQYLPGKRWLKEGTKFLGNRGHGNPALLGADGNNINESAFTACKKPLAITDAHLISGEVEKAIHLAEEAQENRREAAATI
jgi:hypothetical protein